MHYSIIINPVAGGGRGNSTWSTVKAALDAAQLDYTPLFTRTRKEPPTSRCAWPTGMPAGPTKP